MKLHILIGGKAGQGINKVSEIVSEILVSQGYFIFNYRDYPSLVRGGHNFNILGVSDKRIGSIESVLDIIICLDDKTLNIHKKQLKKDGIVISYEGFENLGRNLNIALAGCLIKILGIDKEILIKQIKKEFDNIETINSAEKGYQSQEKKFDLKKLNNKIQIMSGSTAVAKGAVNSGINLYLAYPMTPATGVMNELAKNQIKNNLMVFQPENEIAVVNAGLGASFSGAKVMVGTSGGGFDLMTEGLSLQGISEIPLVVYLASRPGPGTGVPTYSTQADLNIALKAGHGEFPRIVIAPGDPIEAIEKTNEAFYLSEKFNALSIILSDKHLAESEFSSDRKPNKIIPGNINRKIPGKEIVKASSYEHDEFGNTTESPEITKKNAELRLENYEKIKKETEKFEMIKIFGNKKSKNLIIGWGSTKTVILDAIEELDCKFLQVLYLKPMSNKIKKELENSNKVILVEQNLTGQLGRLIREKTGIKIENRILKYDSCPFNSDKLKKEIEERLK
ncbi:MAG: 2-oxoacid:acceptor oxidoreductase family protein [Nanoarchaeota archaeon]|nr:2-oxoacid:acceptor oxidoreductase family protein [Nanoarchaeota archaeon]